MAKILQENGSHFSYGLPGDDGAKNGGAECFSILAWQNIGHQRGRWGEREIVDGYLSELDKTMFVAADVFTLIKQNLLDLCAEFLCEQDFPHQKTIKHRPFTLSCDEVSLLGAVLRERLMSNDPSRPAFSACLAAADVSAGLGYIAVISCANDTHSELRRCLYEEHIKRFLVARDVLRQQLALSSSVPPSFTLSLIADYSVKMIDIAAVAFNSSTLAYCSTFKNALIMLFGEELLVSVMPNMLEV